MSKKDVTPPALLAYLKERDATLTEEEKAALVKAEAGDRRTLAERIAKARANKVEEPEVPGTLKETRFDYAAEDGTRLRKVRIDFSYRPKDFRWEHFANGQWVGCKGCRHRVLPYRIDEVLAADPSIPVWIFEGEKCRNLWHEKTGLPVTTSPHGQGKWDRWQLEKLAGRRVIVVPDHNTPEGAAEAVEELKKGIARSAVLYILPGMEGSGDTVIFEPKEDVEQWLSAGLPVEPAINGGRAALTLEEMRTWPPEAETGIVSDSEFRDETVDPVPSLLGNGVIAKETLNLLAGESGTGKTTWALNAVACLGAGKDFLGLSVPEPVAVLFIEAEGNRDRFRERWITVKRSLDLEGQELPVSFQARGASYAIGDSLEAMIRSSGAKLVVLDTVGFFHEGEENSASDWKNGIVKPVRLISSKTGAAFLVLHHVGKPAEHRTGKHRIRGTSAMEADADTVLMLEAAKTGADLRVLTFAKIKNGPPLEPLVVRFDQERALFERTNDDAVMVLKPRLGEVQRILRDQGADMTTAELVVAIMEQMGLGRSQAEGLIGSAHEAGVIERRKRGVYGLPGTLLPVEVPF